jgi:alpha-L-arabinofuranosidase
MIFSTQAGAETRFTIHNQVEGKIRPELFGHFLERASFGEPGPENALVPGTGELQPAVIELLRQMKISVVRFPAGGDVDFMDWTDLIDNAPGRKDPKRPKVTRFARTQITNRFGFDEYFAVAEDLKWQTVLCINLRDAVAGKVPVKQAALHAAGLVAYCNAQQGAKLPEGMPDYPAIRGKNGHPKPFTGVRYVQLGNEWWLFREEAFRLAGKNTVAERKEWLIHCLTTCMTTIKAVDPTVEFVMDAPSNLEDPLMVELWASPEIKQHNPIATFHHYAPGPMHEISLDDKKLDLDDLSREQLWKALVSMPGEFSVNSGVSLAFGPNINYAKKLGFRVGSTEWNWMAFGFEKLAPAVRPAQVSGIGAANFLNGLLRQSDDMVFATQSMLVGSSWPIACIKVDPDGKRKPEFSPTGFITMLYANHRGDHVLRVTGSGIPVFAQPLKIGWAKPHKMIASLDVVATADKDTVYLHIINREFAKNIPTTFTLDAHTPAGLATLHQFQAANELANTDNPAYHYEKSTLDIVQKEFQLTVPARSVLILKIPLEKKP